MQKSSATGLYNFLSLLFFILAMGTIAVVVVLMLQPAPEEVLDIASLPTPIVLPTETETPTITPTFTPATPQAEVSGSVSVYIQPDFSSQIIGQFTEGTILEIIGITVNQDWYEVRLPDGGSGWIPSSPTSARFVGDRAALQIVGTPTFTSTPTATLTATYTPSLTPTITNTPGPTDTPSSTPTPSVSPTPQPTETPTGPTPTIPPTLSPFLFALRTEIEFLPNANAAGCAWTGVSGSVLQQDGQPVVEQYVIRVFSDTGDFENLANTGSNTTFGEISGWEVPISNVLNTRSYFVRVESMGGTPISDNIRVTFPGDCAQNRAVLRFIQTRDR
jgi:hypothetical protein